MRGMHDLPLFRPQPPGLARNKRLTRWLAIGVIVAAFLWTGSTLGEPHRASPSDAITWDPTRPIEWEHFRGTPPAETLRIDEVAVIHLTIRWFVQYELAYDSGSERWKGTILRDTLQVTNTMDPQQSWVIREKTTDEALHHERGHFDLNEVYRRKLFALLSQLRVFEQSLERARSALQEAIAETANRILDVLEGVQAAYDQDTAHGTNRQAQANWEQRIADWLNSPARASEEASGIAARIE